MSTRTTTVKWWGVGSALLMIVGGIGPWVTVGGTTIANGTEKDGVILIALGLIAGGLLVWRGGAAKWPAIVALSVAVLAVVISIADLGSVSGDSIAAALADPGWGLYLDLVASISLVAATAVLLIKSRSTAAAAPVA